MNNLEENRDFIERISRSADIQEEKKIFDSFVGETSIWWLIGEKLDKKSVIVITADKNVSLCSNFSESRLRDKCLNCLLKKLRNVFKSSRPIQFNCNLYFFGMAFPIPYNGQISASLGICHLNKNIPSLVLENLRIAIKIIADKIKKEQELSKLYETVKPRAIALSTVHTVHRLIGSTLNLEELLPRIARLSLQVLRGKKCIITLVDPIKRIILPKTFIDIDKKTANIKKMHLKLTLEKRVIRTGKIYLDSKRLCVPLMDQEIIGTVRVESKQDNKSFTNFDQEILTVLGEQAVIAIKNAQLYEERGRMLLGSIKSLAAILDARLPDTYTHPIGFVEIVLEIGKELKLSEEKMESLKYAALLLDAGKIGIPDEILMKPTKLTGKEYSFIKEHPIKGAEIVGSIEPLKPAIPLIMHHHERFDGTGYPMKLRKEQIPLGARIIALADAFEAMICKRPYRGTMKINDAVEEIRKSSGTQFDPIVVKAFINLVRGGKIKNIICRLQKRLV